MADHGALRVTVLARQRLALGVGGEVSYFTGTHPFVPGSVLRGALAAAWIAGPGHGPPVTRAGNGRAGDFRALFDGDIRYGPLHVTGSDVVPVSAWLCKYPKHDKNCAVQAVDAVFETGTSCPSCGGPLEQGKGQVLLPPGVVLERIMRTSIDRETATSADGELYAHAALPAGTTLTGFIHGRHSWLEQPMKLRLGGRRTVGGAADYNAVPATPERPAQPWLSGGRLVIRLASPAIFTDAAGRPRLDPDPDLDLRGATTEQSWHRPATWQGWHAASRLPKPSELCAVAGSTYLIGGPADVLRALAERLLAEGIGLRRTEGFGQVQVVTSPWRPPSLQPPARLQDTADVRLLDWEHKIRGLSLDPARERWIVGALRDLQLSRQRAASEQDQAPEELAKEIMGRPGAEVFGGRQRDLLRELFAEPDLRVLRDLTTLLLARLPADPRRPADGPDGTEAGP